MKSAKKIAREAYDKAKHGGKKVKQPKQEAKPAADKK